jgi:transcriptional regulator with PAS, ATPase and Fis domain
MPNYHDRPLIGWSQPMQEVHTHINEIAPTELTVIILGERGTGKELVAQEIHLKSGRTGLYIRVNCASLPETLVETELFGCEKGAFTGAEFRQGRFEQAHGGTLFLDEIGELSVAAQPKLLRILQTKEVDRVGGKKPVPVDFRLIVATNQNLEEMVRVGKFRADLYDRLNMDSIRVPPLRKRLDDIPVLSEYFVGLYRPQARRVVTGVSQQVLDVFRTYSWPGNIRELENIIRCAVFKGRSELIRLKDLPFGFAQKNEAVPVQLGNYRQLMRENSRQYSRQLLLAALSHCRNHKPNAARLLDLSRAQFYKLVKMHGLDGEPVDGGSQQDVTQESDWML